MSKAIRKGESGLDSGSVGHVHKGLCYVQSPVPQEKKEKEKGDKLASVAPICNPSTEAAEAGGPSRDSDQLGLYSERAPDQPQLQRKILSLKEVGF